jgi:selenocysteine lyase/cysteine desulfurase
MKLTEANKQVIKNIFNDYLNQYKAAGIAHNEAIQFAMHKTRQNAALMINTYFK